MIGSRLRASGDRARRIGDALLVERLLKRYQARDVFGAEKRDACPLAAPVIDVRGERNAGEREITVAPRHLCESGAALRGPGRKADLGQQFGRLERGAEEAAEEGTRREPP